MDNDYKNNDAINIFGDDDLESNQVILTPTQMVLKRFFRNKLAVIGIIVIVLMALFSFVGPLFIDYDQNTLFYIVTRVDENGNEIQYEITDDELAEVRSKYKDAHVITNVKAEPSSAHLLGTDTKERDIFTRLMYGGRISLRVGFIVVFIELLIGVILGGIAGYYGGAADMIIMRLVEIFYAIPFIPLMLIISSIMIQYDISPTNKINYIMLIMGVLYWAGVARMIRGQILSLREMEYMQAAEATGIRPVRRILRHLIPNVMPIIIIIATMDLGGIILMESTMSYLGVGVPESQASWGNMVGVVSTTTNLLKYWYMWLPPGICILLTVLAFNFIGDGLRDAFDPKMKR